MAIDIQALLTHGIDAWAETQQVRYQANAPVPQNRGAGDVSAPEGQPAFTPLGDTLRDTAANPVTWVLLGVAAILTVVVLRR